MVLLGPVEVGMLQDEGHAEHALKEIEGRFVTSLSHERISESDLERTSSQIDLGALRTSDHD